MSDLADAGAALVLVGIIGAATYVGVQMTAPGHTTVAMLLYTVIAAGIVLIGLGNSDDEEADQA